MHRRLFIACVAAAALAGCSTGGGHVDLQGAGATFPYPLYSRWVAEYQKLHPRVRVNYQSIGSGGGIRQILERTVDFGATDVPMTDDELARAPGRLLHVPTTLGAVVLAYQVPGAGGGLRLSPGTVAGIYLGEIARWNDARIAADNPGVTLPGDAITVAYRSDGSGTTAVFTRYLAEVSPAWKEKVGAGKSVKFPVGLGAKGNEGVAGQVKTTPGAIGYVELAYAEQAGLAHASLKNAAGAFVAPTLDAIGTGAYALSAPSYVLVYAEQPEGEKGRALVEFLRWAIHDGQALGAELHYAPLPPELVERAEAALKSITVGGEPVL